MSLGKSKIKEIHESGVVVFSETCTVKAENLKLGRMKQHMFKWTSITKSETNRQFKKLHKLPDIDDKTGITPYLPDRESHYIITLIVIIGWTLVVFWIIRKYLKSHCHTLQVLKVFLQRFTIFVATLKPSNTT